MGTILTPAEYQRFHTLYLKFVSLSNLTPFEISELNSYFARLRLYKQQLPQPKPNTPPPTVPIANPPATDPPVLV